MEAVKLVRHPRVAAVIAEADKQAEARISAVVQQYAITQERLAQSLAKLALANMRDYVAWGPEGVRLKPSDQLSHAQAYGVVEIRQTKAGITVKLHDKARALMDLAKLQGWMEPRREELPPAPDEEKRRSVRAKLIAMLDVMAVPEPLEVHFTDRPGST